MSASANVEVPRPSSGAVVKTAEGEKDMLLPKDQLGSESFLMRPFLWIVELADAFGASFMVMLFVAQHCMKGFSLSLISSSFYFLLAAFGVGAEQMGIYYGVIMLPWSMKPIIGLVSDCFPVFGYNKAPYMMIACFAGVLALLAVGFHMSFLTAELLVFAIFLMMLMFSVCDLLTEAKYATMMRKVPHLGPDLMTYVWFGLQAGGLVAVLVVGPMMTHWSIYSPCLLSIVPVVVAIILLSMNYMKEEHMSTEEVRKVRGHMWDQKEACILCMLMLVGSCVLTVIGILFSNVMVNVVASLIVLVIIIGAFMLLLRPLIAKVNTFFVIQTTLSLSYSGSSFYFFTDNITQYPEGPHFSVTFYSSVLGLAGAIFSMIGIYTYQRWWKNWRYQSLIIFTNLVYCALCLSDCVLYSRLNVKLGIPDKAFVLGSSALQYVIYQWMWVPGIVIMSQLCPKDMEATMYALLAGCHNLGSTVASSCGSLLLLAFGVTPSGEIGESDKFSNLWKCALVASFLPLLTLISVPWLIPDAGQTEHIIGEEDRDATKGSVWKRLMGE